MDTEMFRQVNGIRNKMKITSLIYIIYHTHVCVCVCVFYKDVEI